MRKVGYLALDDGPRLTLQSLATQLQGQWLSGELHPSDVELLICGTSDSADGRAIEGSARAAARELGIPTVVVEDFPGNFSANPTVPRLVYVESEFAAGLARRASPTLAVHVGPAIRYDGLRRTLDALRTPRGQCAANAVLWVGQPETRDSLRTLGALMPALQSGLWFRAHPRDEGYRNGAYASLFDQARIVVEDLTELPLDECLRRRPRVVITQFSSVAIEAGFWGLPALHLLLPDAGAGRLLAKKGYAMLPWCEAGAAFCATRSDEIAGILECAMRSERARAEVLERFDNYFKVRDEGAPGLVEVLYNQGLL